MPNSNLNFELGTIWTADNLDVMKGMNSETVDLVYLDPPFNSDKKWQHPLDGKLQKQIETIIEKDEVLFEKWLDYVDDHYDQSSDKVIMEFEDAWDYDEVKEEQKEEIRQRIPVVYQIIEAVGESHSLKMKAYLIFMSVRLIEMQRILRPSGSIFLHCDPTANSYIRLIMDAVFGAQNMRNEIVWGYTGPGSPKMRQFNRKHDTIYWYSNGDQWTFNKDDVRIEHVDGGPHAGGFLGELDKSTTEEYGNLGKVPESWWVQSKGNGLAIAARQRKQYIGYPTQKPIALLERIIKASSNKGEIVFDPFCGCATAIEAANKLDRNWIGCDLSFMTVPLVRLRCTNSYGSNPDKLPVRKDKKEINQPPLFITKLSAKAKRVVKKRLFGMQEGVCNGCGRPYDFKIFAMDHVKPRSKGGDDDEENLQLLCAPCNSRKGAKDERECTWMYKFSDEYKMAA